MALKSALVLAFTAGFIAQAGAMEPAQCRTFLTGTWSVTPAIPGEPVIKVTYNADGTFQRGTEAPDAAGTQDPAATGAWQAKPGLGKESCEIMLTPEGAEPRAINFTVTGQDGFRTAEGEIAERQPDAAPALIN